MWHDARTVIARERQPVPSGIAYRANRPPENEPVTRPLARELHAVLERFASDAGFDRARPVSVTFKPGIFGHHKVGRAADIYAVGGVGLDEWKLRWDQTMVEVARTESPPRRTDIIDRERRTNLGWRLYKSLQRYGRWSQPCGYPIQLFGPWTRSEGPWKNISDFLLHAHRDHIHVAK